MNEHIELLPQLAAYHDSELGDADTKKIEAHLEGCSSCRLALQDFKALDAAILNLEQPELDDRGIYLKVLADIRKNETHAGSPRWRSRWVVGAVAAALILFGLGSREFWRQSQLPLATVEPSPAKSPDDGSTGEAEQTTPEARVDVAEESTDGTRAEGTSAAADRTPDSDRVNPDSHVLAVTTEVANNTDITTAPMSLEIGDSGIPQDSARLARLFDNLSVDVHFRALAEADPSDQGSLSLDVVELNLVPEYEAEFVGIGYAIGDLLDPGHQIEATEPVQLSPEQTHLVLSLRLEQSALASRTSHQVTSEATAVRMADISWRLATITADRNDVHVAIRAQTAVMRTQPALTARSMARLAALSGMIQE